MKGDVKRKEGESERERRRERQIQPERLCESQLFSEAAEKSKCLPAFLLGMREGWIGRGLAAGKRRRRGGVERG